jgi:Bacterial archaeo-eukaryotic release factor family 2
VCGHPGSVYFVDAHDSEDARAQIELKWRGLREQLVRQGAAPALTDNLEQAIGETDPTVGGRGRAIVAAAEGVLVDEHLIRPTASPVARLSALPYIVPVVEHGVEHSSYVVVTVDHAGGDISLHRDGAITSDAVDGGGYPVHKAHGAQTSGYGDPQLVQLHVGARDSGFDNAELRDAIEQGFNGAGWP